MNISTTLMSSLQSLSFDSYHSAGYTSPNSDTPAYTSNNIFCQFLKVIIPYKGKCFIPTVNIKDTLSFIERWFNDTEQMGPMEICVPLYAGGEMRKRTTDSIIRAINNCNRHYRLCSIITKDGLSYYGGNGIVTDGKRNPMMLLGFNVEIDKGNQTISVIEPSCKISPIVFTNKDILSKGIISKIIPFFSTEGVYLPNFIRNYISYMSSRMPVSITIGSLDNYFVSPEEPGDIEELDTNIWNYLSDNSGNIYD